MIDSTKSGKHMEVQNDREDSQDHKRIVEKQNHTANALKIVNIKYFEKKRNCEGAGLQSQNSQTKYQINVELFKAKK